MKFDNAFLTKSGNIGLQFKDKGEILTVYKDGKGKLIVSEHATIQQKGILVVKYGQMAHRYEKKAVVAA
jgi:hypothetical protein